MSKDLTKFCTESQLTYLKIAILEKVVREYSFETSQVNPIMKKNYQKIKNHYIDIYYSLFPDDVSYINNYVTSEVSKNG